MQLPNTFLSLYEMSLCNIALQVFNDPDVRHFTRTHCIHSCIWSNEEIEAFLGEEPTFLVHFTELRGFLSFGNKPNFSHLNKGRFALDGKGHSLPNKQWEILLNQKLSSLSLPSMFKKEATALVKLVLIESYKWFQDHKPVIKSTTNLEKHFQWTLDNKIDRQKTAKAIIHDDNIDIRDRFVLACHYCFQEDVFSIWGILDDAQRNSFLGWDFLYVHAWVRCAIIGEELNWEEIAVFSFFGFQTYFLKLEQEKRLQYLMHYNGEIWSNYHELQFCLSILDQNQQHEILKKFPFQVIKVFFDWPVQKQLLDVVDLLWPYLSEQNCGDLLYLILSQKCLFHWIGSDYVTLVKRLWERVSFQESAVLEKYTNFNSLKLVLEYDGSHPFPHQSHVHSNEDGFMTFHAGTTVLVISKSYFSSLMFSLKGILPFYDKIDMLCFVKD